MTHKFTDLQTLIITPVTLSRTPKVLEVWKHPKEGTSHVVVYHAGSKITLPLSAPETRALAKHLDPEAHAAKGVLKKLALTDALSKHQSDITDVSPRDMCICGAEVADWDEHRADAVLALLNGTEA